MSVASGFALTLAAAFALGLALAAGFALAVALALAVGLATGLAMGSGLALAFAVGFALTFDFAAGFVPGLALVAVLVAFGRDVDLRGILNRIAVAGAERCLPCLLPCLPRIQALPGLCR